MDCLDELDEIGDFDELAGCVNSNSQEQDGLAPAVEAPAAKDTLDALDALDDDHIQAALESSQSVDNADLPGSDGPSQPECVGNIGVGASCGEEQQEQLEQTPLELEQREEAACERVDPDVGCIGDASETNSSEQPNVDPFVEAAPMEEEHESNEMPLTLAELRRRAEEEEAAEAEAEAAMTNIHGAHAPEQAAAAASVAAPEIEDAKAVPDGYKKVVDREMNEPAEVTSTKTNADAVSVHELEGTAESYANECDEDIDDSTTRSACPDVFEASAEEKMSESDGLENVREDMPSKENEAGAEVSMDNRMDGQPGAEEKETIGCCASSEGASDELNCTSVTSDCQEREYQASDPHSTTPRDTASIGDEDSTTGAASPLASGIIPENPLSLSKSSPIPSQDEEMSPASAEPSPPSPTQGVKDTPESRGKRVREKDEAVQDTNVKAQRPVVPEAATRQEKQKTAAAFAAFGSQSPDPRAELFGEEEPTMKIGDADDSTRHGADRKSTSPTAPAGSNSCKPVNVAGTFADSLDERLKSVVKRFVEKGNTDKRTFGQLLDKIESVLGIEARGENKEKIYNMVIREMRHRRVASASVRAV